MHSKLFRIYILLLFLWLSAAAQAQITGVVTDVLTGDTIAYPSASYKGHHMAVSGDAQGRFSIEYHEGWVLTISAVGYQSKEFTMKANSPLTMAVKLKPDTRTLKEVVAEPRTEPAPVRRARW